MPTTLSLWICHGKLDNEEQLALDSEPVAALRAALGDALVSIDRGPATWLRVELTTGPGRETAGQARRWTKKRAPGWIACDAEPRHTLYLLTMSEPAEVGAAELRDALREWSAEERAMEITVSDHPTIPHMLRVDVAGAFSEETFHLWDGEAHVWCLDVEPLRTERQQEEPRLCPDCGGEGCEACGDVGVVPESEQGPGR